MRAGAVVNLRRLVDLARDQVVGVGEVFKRGGEENGADDRKDAGQKKKDGQNAGHDPLGAPLFAFNGFLREEKSSVHGVLLLHYYHSLGVLNRFCRLNGGDSMQIY